MMTNEELVKVTAADSKAASLTELTLPPSFVHRRRPQGRALKIWSRQWADPFMPLCGQRRIGYFLFKRGCATELQTGRKKV
ncbi:hypothetical protein [Candidatus Electronema sp. TJ]|uniref:hypothetical protein n=1 Tax=Candidatus Electronema sp. TJ TaxID=3401573 RepID=UPI003AA9CC9C